MFLQAGTHLDRQTFKSVLEVLRTCIREILVVCMVCERQVVWLVLRVMGGLREQGAAYFSVSTAALFLGI